MKKLLSVILALVMILSLSTVAFADDGDATEGTPWDGTYTATESKTFNEIVKTYKSENNVVVNETLSFTSVAKTTNPDNGDANLSVADLNVTTLTPGTLAVTIPSLSKAGSYEWVITEDAGNTAGVTYSNAQVHVIVVVGYDNDLHKLVILNTNSYIMKPENGDKLKEYENTFASGSFTVAKHVDGNMANKNDNFEIVVTLTSTKPVGSIIKVAGANVLPSQWVPNTDKTSYTYTSTMNYSDLGGAKAFEDIPVGVTVSVVETDTDTNMQGYTYVNTSGVVGNNFTLTVGDNDTTANKNVVVNNEKSTTVEMGVTLDSLPYILLLAVACVGMAVVLTKKRRED